MEFSSKIGFELSFFHSHSCLNFKFIASCFGITRINTESNNHEGQRTDRRTSLGSVESLDSTGMSRLGSGCHWGRHCIDVCSRRSTRHRDCLRVEADNKELADRIWERIKEMVRNFFSILWHSEWDIQRNTLSSESHWHLDSVRCQFAFSCLLLSRTWALCTAPWCRLFKR